MTCLACRGDGWLRRQVQHPCLPGKLVQATRVCLYCDGKGRVVEPDADWRQRAAGDTDRG